MTDQDLERRLRAWYRAEIPDAETAPDGLRADLATIPRPGRLSERIGGDVRGGTGRTAVLLIAAATAIALIGTTVAAGSGLFRQSAILPASSAEQSLTVASEQSPAQPSDSLNPTGSGPLGGSLILAEEFIREKPSPLALVDGASSTRTALGTLPASFGFTYALDWSTDHRHVLVEALARGDHVLDHPTDAARALDFVCCLPVDASNEYRLSPAGDQVAAIRWAGKPDNDHVTAIVVVDLASGHQRVLRAPDGVERLGGLAWSADGSTLAAVGCRPCAPTAHPTQWSEAGQHLFLVPLDGTPWRELLNRTATWLTLPSWSPDGSTVALADACLNCTRDTADLLLVNAADGTAETIDAAGSIASKPAWSPDGQRIAFIGSDGRGYVVGRDGSDRTELLPGPMGGFTGQAPVWSPDGEWLLFRQFTQSGPGFGDMWIVSSDGGGARNLGDFGAFAW